jgi:mono/diheme cytochrome c family protein/DNA-binding beta-propeller fold protein YncE
VRIGAKEVAVRPSIITLPAIPAALFLASCSLYVGQEPPPSGTPISGGSMIVSHDGETAYVADPERDLIYIVDLARRDMSSTIELEPGDEPGRLVEDDAGRVFVALRRGGAIVTLENGAITDRRDVCPAPRGVAYQADGDLIHVACATGELVSLRASGGNPTRVLHLDRDLRDVVVEGNDLYVSRFRAAELLRVDGNGTVMARQRPAVVDKTVFDPNTGAETQTQAVPAVAWRTIPISDGRVMMLHQRATRAVLSTQSQGGYGGGECFDGPIEVTATIFDPATPDVVEPGRRFTMAQLPVDVAVSPDGSRVAMVMAGFRTVRVVNMRSIPSVVGDDPCGGGDGDDQEIFADSDWWGAPTSVGYVDENELIIQYDNAIAIRNPGQFTSQMISLDGPNRLDPGRRRFHEPTFAGLACASCHPEGRDDGLVWSFDVIGDRRTQQIAGNLEKRAPYHWDGDMTDLHMLINEVLVFRMGGNPLSGDEEDAMKKFLFRIDPLPAPSGLDESAVARGKALFDDPVVGCASCHGGEIYTTNARENVGTGGSFKVPSLVAVGWRAPYLHTGCAATLRDRFDPACGGDNHGTVENLSEAQIGDLVAYLESL